MTDETLNPESNDESAQPKVEAEEQAPVTEPEEPVAEEAAPAEPEEEVEAAETEPAAAEADAEEEAAAEEEEAEEAEEEAEEEEAEDEEEPVESAEANGHAAAVSNKQWYVVKVQSGREESIKDAIEKRVKIEGLEDYFGQIIIPVERVTEMRRNKRVTRTRKLYPGYLMVEVEFNDRILYLFRETTGVGDFVGGGLNRPPPPMSPREVDKIIGPIKDRDGGTVIPDKPPFAQGDPVKVRDGTFSGMEGVVKEIQEAKGLVVVELQIFGRPVPVELEYWQVET